MVVMYMSKVKKEDMKSLEKAKDRLEDASTAVSSALTALTAVSLDTSGQSDIESKKF